MAIIDIMSSDISVVGEGDFTAAAAPPASVTVNPPGVAGLDFSNANGDKWFERGDNIKVSRVWCDIPYGFAQGLGIHQIGVVWKDSLNNATIITEFAGNSIITIPDLCGDLDLNGLFIGNVSLGRRRLTLTNIVLNVSMVNLPADLVAAVVPVQYHIEVLHTKALVGVP